MNMDLEKDIEMTPFEIKKQVEDMLNVNSRIIKELAVIAHEIETILEKHDARLTTSDSKIFISKKGPDGYFLECELDDFIN